ncbi:MAG: 5-formyltetrahydrofolate cyclo-ligase [Gammaproteobacteria bacterium]|jgi:5-formyltetrahydrofolate cyclo-ligase|nr:5-formyltetrahydrofolate cyclo-ligase [Gammaproteobacteria bacterium]
MADKAQIRQQMRDRRMRLGDEERDTAAHHAARLLAGLRWLGSAERVALYVPSMGEIDVLEALSSQRLANKQIYLPVLTPGPHPGLRFSPLPDNDRWTLNRYRIPEPDVAARHWCPASRIDLVFTPLVAFDSDGTRLGMGGGFYDRALANLARRRSWRRPRVVGIAFDFQRAEGLPRDPWDVSLDAVVTDRQVYFSNGAGP